MREETWKSDENFQILSVVFNNAEFLAVQKPCQEVKRFMQDQFKLPLFHAIKKFFENLCRWFFPQLYPRRHLKISSAPLLKSFSIVVQD